MLRYNSNTFLVLVIIIAFCSTVLPQDKDPLALRLILKLEKNTFLVDEPIYYEVVEENISNKRVSTSPFFSPSALIFFKIILVNSRGDTLLYKGSVAFLIIDKDRPGEILAPGEKLYDVRDLLGIFGNRDEAHGISYYLPPDHYRMKVIHNTNYHAPLEWNEAVAVSKGDAKAAEKMIDRMPIESNEVAFEVIEPEGMEKIVQGKLVNIYRRWGKIVGREPIEIIPLLNEIIKQYPQSVYTKAAYFSMTSFLDPVAKSQTLWNRDVILNKYPNSFFVYSIIELLNLNDQEEELNLILRKYPNTKIQEYCEYHITKLRKRKAK